MPQSVRKSNLPGHIHRRYSSQHSRRNISNCAFVAKHSAYCQNSTLQFGAPAPGREAMLWPRNRKNAR